MRLNDRMIKEELRKEATSVPIPDDMWANISRELDKDVARAKVPVGATPRSHSRMQVRQMLAIGAAAGIFWMMIIPSGAYVDRFQQPSPTAAASTPMTVTPSETPWDIPTEANMKAPRGPQGKAGHDSKRPGFEIMLR